MTVKFGINFATYGSPSFDLLLEAAMDAERRGFDAIWVPDHLFLPRRIYEAVGASKRDMLDAWTTLAAMAVVTDKMKLGPCVTPLPLRNPAILAKTIASLDNLSKGRLIFGAGGGWFKEEFQGYGVAWDSFHVRIAKMREGITLMKKLWVEATTSYRGRYYTSKDTPLWPKPVQKPHPPIWFGGESDAILKTTAELGDGWIPWGISTRKFEEKYAQIQTLAKKMGRDPASIEPACCLMTSISKDYDAARNVAEHYVKHFFGRTLDQTAELIIFGKPDDCIQQVEGYVQAGASHIALRPMHCKDILPYVKLYGEHVIPYFKELSKDD